MRTPCTLPLDPPLHGSLTLPWKASLISLQVAGNIPLRKKIYIYLSSVFKD